MLSTTHSLGGEIVGHLLRLASNPGYNHSLLPGVRLLRANAALERTPVLYEPCIVFVCQGRKRGFLGDAVFVYDARHYLVLSVPLPFASQTEASADEPMLAISMKLDFKLLAEVMLTLSRQKPAGYAAPASMVSTPIDEALSEAILRLVKILGSALDCQVLGEGIIKEIYYRVLLGEQGEALRAALDNQGHFGQIARAMQKIQQQFAARIDVTELAANAGMSIPAFHAHFKAVTQSTPMQYLKSTRLHQARLLMVRSGLSAAEVAIRVGYESPSQFSREFKRLFSRSPRQEAVRMRDLLQVKAALAWPDYITLEE
ncbi:AraC family transcriptional regulator [Sodalis sp. RH22]|uniref:AraC family transcriptional regulator n=1 Tax=unclassified Sodalis (in: enterobacteria) TaxID=2636512 RepID=UPI0039B6419B